MANVSVTLTGTPDELKVLRDVLALTRGDVRSKLNSFRTGLDEVLGADHDPTTVGKRWRVKPILRNNGTVKYVEIQARQGNTLV